MQDYTRIYSAKIKTIKDFYLSCAMVHFYTNGEIEYCAQIEDGGRPAPYLDKKNLELIHPPGHTKTIVRAAGSWADALEQLQALADKYGTLPRGAGIISTVTKGTPRNDSKDDD